MTSPLAVHPLSIRLGKMGPAGALLGAMLVVGSTARAQGTSSGSDEAVALPPAPESTSPRLERQAVERDERDERHERDEAPNHILYAGAQLGGAYLDSVVFSNDNFIPGATRLNGGGVTTGIVAGVKLWLITVGGRFTYSSFDAFDVGTLGLDVGVRLPLPIVEPYFRLGASYAFTASAGYGGRTDSDVFGLALDAGLGLDLYLVHWAALGLGIDAAFLNLSRQGIGDCATPTCQIEEIDFSEDGDAAGLLLRFFLQARFEFL